MRPLTRLSLLCAGIGVLLVTAPQASGATTMQSGWWTTAPVVIAPDAPKGGLVVQGGPSADQPVSFAALSYAVDRGFSPSTLELSTSPGAASTPNAVLVACPLTSSFTPAEGGPAASAPTYDCANKVTASASSDGAFYRFDVLSLARNTTVAIAILPAAPTDRIVLAQPDTSSLTVVQVDRPAAGGVASDPPFVTTAPSGGIVPPPVVATPTTARSSVGAAAGPTSNVAPPSVTAAANRASSGAGRGLVFALLAITAVALWHFSGTRSRMTGSTT